MLSNRYAIELLRNRTNIFSEISDEKDLGKLIKYYMLTALLFSAVYGLFMGCYSGGLQIVSVALKVPLLIFGTLGICIPSLYTFNVLLGSKLSFKQTLAVAVMSTYLLSLILVSLAPIMLFFTFSSDNKSFLVLLNVFFFTVSGLFGVSLLWHCMKFLALKDCAAGVPAQDGETVTVKSGNHIIKVWTIIYIFVGTQMAWLLRPFIGLPGDFSWFRELGGNIYMAIITNLFNMF